jgi:hypothetical protein
MSKRTKGVAGDAVVAATDGKHLPAELLRHAITQAERYSATPYLTTMPGTGVKLAEYVRECAEAFAADIERADKDGPNQASFENLMDWLLEKFGNDHKQVKKQFIAIVKKHPQGESAMLADLVRLLTEAQAKDAA